MKLAEFAKILHESEDQTYHPKDETGYPRPVLIWQVLTLSNGFSKTIQTERESITESEFTNIARRPFYIAMRPKLKFIVEDLSPAPEASERVTFYPELDEGWATPQSSGELRIKMFYYEK